jgi:hypothetical protein
VYGLCRQCCLCRQCGHGLLGSVGCMGWAVNVGEYWSCVEFGCLV